MRGKKYNITKGDFFGKLEVISDKFSVKTKSSSRCYYKVKCSCGKIFDTSGTSLRAKNKKSCVTCAMQKREQNKLFISQEQQLYNKYIILRSKTINLDYDISMEEFLKTIKSDCFYCDSEPVDSVLFSKRKYVNNKPFKVNGIDRVDSNKGYITGNIVPCCTVCNVMKMDLSLKDFFDRINKIYNKHLNK